MNLLSGQTVFLTAVVTEPMRYIAVDREVLRQLLFEDGSLSDLLLSAFIERRELLQQRAGDRDRDRRPARLGRDPAPARLRPAPAAPPLLARPERERGGGGAARRRSSPTELPLVRLPGGAELRAAEQRRALAGARDRARAGAARGGRPAGHRRRAGRASAPPSTAPRRASTRWWSRAPCSAARPGTSRRIENYLGFPAGISGTELTSRAVTQARKFGARTATPYRAQALEPGERAPPGQARGRQRDRAPGRCCSRPAPNTGACRSTTSTSYEGISVFYAAGPPEAQLCGGQRVGVVGGGNSAGAGGRLAGPRRRPGHPPAPPRRPRRDDVPLPDRRARPLRRRRPRPQRNQRAARRRRPARGGHPHRRRPSCRSRSSSSSSAPRPAPTGSATCVARDEKGFVLTGPDAGAEGLLETSVPGVYAAGDVRAGSIKRCATAVGEGATVVRFVHEHISAASASV